MNVILASGSKYRQALLNQIGLPFSVILPEVDEASLKDQGLQPQILARRLAALKGEAVRLKSPHSLIIASDQVAHLQGRILSKPGTRERAIETLLQLQGQTHELITALWMSHPEQGVREVQIHARMKMRSLTKGEIETYVDHDRPLDCAGAYKWEQAGVTLLEQMSCEDPTSIVGLPLIALTQALSAWRLPLPFAWKNQRSL